LQRFGRLTKLALIAERTTEDVMAQDRNQNQNTNQSKSAPGRQGGQQGGVSSKGVNDPQKKTFNRDDDDEAVNTRSSKSGSDSSSGMQTKGSDGSGNETRRAAPDDASRND
jgi:hypothetical protein